jgi:oxygen tolerance protein BatD
MNITNHIRHFFRINIYSKSICIVLLILSIHIDAFSQPTFTASVSHNPVAVGQQFRLNFELSSQGSIFTPPDLSPFILNSGPNKSTSMQFINGSMSQSVTYSYILQARDVGKIRIGSASIIANGKKLVTKPIVLNVTKNTTSNNNKQGTSGNNSGQNNISSKDIFIRVVVDKRNVYQGEAIVVTYKLYSKVTLINYGINKVPSLNGFWVQDIELPSQLQLYNEVYNGINYQVGDIKKVIVFPQHSGNLVLDPMEGECIARIRVKRNNTSNPSNPFNDPFFGFRGVRDVKLAVKSIPVIIKVKELPSGAPQGFSGAVGKFSIEGLADKSTLRANDPITFRIKIKGNGNINLINAPPLDLSPDIEQYDPKVNDNISYSNRGASGSRTFEFLLIPRYQGVFEIPPVEFAYFDINKKRYVTLNTKKVLLKIEKGLKGSAATVAGSRKADFQLLNREIRFIKITSPNFDSAGKHFFGSGYFWLLLIAPLVFLSGLIFYRRKLAIDNADLTGLKSKKARKIAKKKLKYAFQLLQKNDEKLFYEEVTKAIWEFIGNKLRIPVSELSRDNVTKNLLTVGYNENTIKELMKVLEYCEMSSYSGTANKRNMNEIYESVVNVISSIENEKTA